MGGGVRERWWSGYDLALRQRHNSLSREERAQKIRALSHPIAVDSHIPSSGRERAGCVCSVAGIRQSRTGLSGSLASIRIKK